MEIIKHTKEAITWAEIAEAKAANALDTVLAERDVIKFTLRDGTETSLTVEKVEPGRAWVGFTDAVAERAMYDEIKRPVSWKESDARQWLNTEFIKQLPEELLAIITPRTICQTVQGEVLETTDLLWIHSITELFGRRNWADGDDQAEEQLEIFTAERDRVKMIEGETAAYYWTRSVYADNSSRFCLVSTDGDAGNLHAYYSRGVAPCFFI